MLITAERVVEALRCVPGADGNENSTITIPALLPFYHISLTGILWSSLPAAEAHN